MSSKSHKQLLNERINLASKYHIPTVAKATDQVTQDLTLLNLFINKNVLLGVRTVSKIL